MGRVLKVLDFCNLLDLEKKLSITNIAVVALVLKMLVSPAIDWPSVVSMVAALGNYMHKRAAS